MIGVVRKNPTAPTSLNAD